MPPVPTLLATVQGSLEEGRGRALLGDWAVGGGSNAGGPGTPHVGSLNLTEDAMERTPKCEEAAGVLSFQEDSQSYPISGLLPVPRLGHRSVTGVCPSLPVSRRRKQGLCVPALPVGVGSGAATSHPGRESS